MVHSYDSLNRVKTIQYGAIKETYSYNPRGWTTEKNVTKNYLPLLNLKLRYENPSNSSSVPQYGGNISEWEWSRNASNINMYSFEYVMRIPLKIHIKMTDRLIPPVRQNIYFDIQLSVSSR